MVRENGAHRTHGVDQSVTQPVLAGGREQRLDDPVPDGLIDPALDPRIDENFGITLLDRDIEQHAGALARSRQAACGEFSQRHVMGTPALDEAWHETAAAAIPEQRGEQQSRADHLGQEDAGRTDGRHGQQRPGHEQRQRKRHHHRHRSIARSGVIDHHDDLRCRQALGLPYGLGDGVPVLFVHHQSPEAPPPPDDPPPPEKPPPELDPELQPPPLEPDPVLQPVL